jgi:hypothetical protein
LAHRYIACSYFYDNFLIENDVYFEGITITRKYSNKFRS